MSIFQAVETFIPGFVGPRQSHISPKRTIQSWIDIGVLAAIRIGKNYRVSRDSLRWYLQEVNDK